MTDLATPPPAPPPASDAGVSDPTLTNKPSQWISLLLVIGLLLALGIFGSWYAVLVVAALIVMVTLHELGHYLTAKWSGMKVTEFFLGFGPRIWSFRRGETEYGLKPILAGAYVRIIGMSMLDPVDPIDEHRTYRRQSYPKRLMVALAGSAMHFLLALVLLFVLFVGYGRPHADVWRIREVVTQVDGAPSPATVAGLQLGDQIVAVNHTATPTYNDTVDALRALPGATVTLTVKRGGSTFDATTTLRDHNDTGEHVGFLGIRGDHPLIGESVPAAAVHSVGEFGTLASSSVKALGSFFTPSHFSGYVDQVLGRNQDQTATSTSPTSGGGNSDGNRFLSPVGAVRIASQAAAQGMPDFLQFFIGINIFVGLFNLVPLLPLDGGHVAVATYERIRSRNGRQYRVDMTKLMPVVYGVFLVLVILGMSALFLDITHPIHNPFSP